MTGKQLRNSILQWAIQGKLVSQDPNDEPASVLLERIRAEKARLVKEKKIKRDKNETIIYRGEDNSYYEKTLATGAVCCIDDEIPFDIPQGWEWCRIKHICSMQAGKNISSAEIFQDKTDLHPYRCVGGNGLRGFVSIYNTTGHYAIVGRQGALCGCLNIENGNFYATEHAVVVDSFNIISPLFLYNFLIALNLNQYATATAQPGLAVSNILEVMFPLPPLSEQARIVSKIETIAPVIKQYEKNEELLRQLNQRIYAQTKASILQEAIQGKLVPQIESEGTAEELLDEIYAEKNRLVKEGKLKKSAIANEGRIFRGDDNKYYEQIGANTINIDEQIPFDIPNSWCWIRLGYIIDFSSNSSVKVSNIEPDSWILDLEDIEKDSGRLLQRKRMSETCAKSDKHRFSTGNILYSKLRPYLNKVLIADMSGYCTSEILVFDFGKIYAEYALAYLRSPFFVEYAMSDAYGVKMPRLGSKQGNNALMPIPPLDEQHRIVNRIKQLDNHFI